MNPFHKKLAYLIFFDISSSFTFMENGLFPVSDTTMHSETAQRLQNATYPLHQRFSWQIQIDSYDSYKSCFFGMFYVTCPFSSILSTPFVEIGPRVVCLIVSDTRTKKNFWNFTIRLKFVKIQSSSIKHSDQIMPVWSIKPWTANFHMAM